MLQHTVVHIWLLLILLLYTVGYSIYMMHMVGYWRCTPFGSTVDPKDQNLHYFDVL